MVGCIETAGFALSFLAMAVLPWRWFYVFQIADSPSYLAVLPTFVKILARIAAFLVGASVLALFGPQCL